MNLTFGTNKQEPAAQSTPCPWGWFVTSKPWCADPAWWQPFYVFATAKPRRIQPNLSGFASVPWGKSCLTSLTCCDIYRSFLITNMWQIATCDESDCKFLLSSDGVLTRSPECNAAACTSVSLNSKGIRQLGIGVFAGMSAVANLWVILLETKWLFSFSFHFFFFLVQDAG